MALNEIFSAASLQHMQDLVDILTVILHEVCKLDMVPFFTCFCWKVQYLLDTYILHDQIAQRIFSTWCMLLHAWQKGLLGDIITKPSSTTRYFVWVLH